LYAILQDGDVSFLVVKERLKQTHHPGSLFYAELSVIHHVFRPSIRMRKWPGSSLRNGRKHKLKSQYRIQNFTMPRTPIPNQATKGTAGLKKHGGENTTVTGDTHVRTDGITIANTLMKISRLHSVLYSLACYDHGDSEADRDIGQDMRLGLDLACK